MRPLPARSVHPSGKPCRVASAWPRKARVPLAFSDTIVFAPSEGKAVQTSEGVPETRSAPREESLEGANAPLPIHAARSRRNAGNVADPSRHVGAYHGRAERTRPQRICKTTFGVQSGNLQIRSQRTKTPTARSRGPERVSLIAAGPLGRSKRACRWRSLPRTQSPLPRGNLSDHERVPVPAL